MLEFKKSESSSEFVMHSPVWFNDLRCGVFLFWFGFLFGGFFLRTVVSIKIFKSLNLKNLVFSFFP